MIRVIESWRKRSRRILLNMRLSRGRNRKRVALVGVIVFFAIITYLHLDGRPDHEFLNYFQPEAELSMGKRLVNNTKCQIPDIQFLRLPQWLELVPPPSCEDQPNITFVDYHQRLVINQDVVEDLGYDPEDVNCCYHTIHRVDQSLDDYDTDADNRFSYSENCYPMTRVTNPISGTIRVTCTAPYWFFWKTTIHQQYHILVNFPKSDTHLQKKLSDWKDCSDGRHRCKYQGLPIQRPPNVFYIGLESTSRLNFNRFMSKSVRVLRDNLSATEMTGFTKVGDNTFPNIAPLLSSYSAEELTSICLKDWSVPQDNCPYIFKNFSNLNYLVAHIEDDPDFTAINHGKTGFVHPPMDIYMRPFMKAAYKSFFDKKSIFAGKEKRCFGPQRVEDVILKYMVDFARVSESHGIPYLITSWLSELTHDVVNNIQRLDSILSTALLELGNLGLLGNTLLLVMSDHGYRHGNHRYTTSGWYEEKLPVLYVRLPDTWTNKYKSFQQALQYNSRELVTPFDIHATAKDFIDLAASQLSGGHPQFPAESSLERPPIRGLSLLQKLPPRSCEEAGVPAVYCACSAPVPSSDFSLATLAAQKLVESVNARLPLLVCAKLEVDKVTAFAKLPKPVSDKETDLIVSFRTTPGNFALEGMVKLDESTGQFSQVSEVLRLNRAVRSLRCLTGSDVQVEIYCYCKLLYILLGPPKQNGYIR